MNVLTIYKFLKLVSIEKSEFFETLRNSELELITQLRSNGKLSQKVAETYTTELMKERNDWAIKVSRKGYSTLYDNTKIVLTGNWYTPGFRFTVSGNYSEDITFTITDFVLSNNFGEKNNQLQIEMNSKNKRIALIILLTDELSWAIEFSSLAKNISHSSYRSSVSRFVFRNTDGTFHYYARHINGDALLPWNPKIKKNAQEYNMGSFFEICKEWLIKDSSSNTPEDVLSLFGDNVLSQYNTLIKHDPTLTNPYPNSKFF